jgi:hypothetical protein
MQINLTSDEACSLFWYLRELRQSNCIPESENVYLKKLCAKILKQIDMQETSGPDVGE